MSPRIGSNGGPPPPPPSVYRRSADEEDVYARLDAQDEVSAATAADVAELKRVVGHFPDINGEGGSGMCKFLYDSKEERAAKRAGDSAVAAFIKTGYGKVSVVFVCLGFLGGMVAGCVKIAADLHWIRPASASVAP